MNKIKSILLFMLLVRLAGFSQERIWAPEQAQAWYDNQSWIIGCNFIPSTAINELEMWQADTFDPETIQRELGWAADIGFNTVRVYLHNLVHEYDAQGLKERMDQYLTIADDLGIKTIFVLFDDCWNPYPKIGKQPLPVPGVHNSGWMQAPGRDRVLDSSTWKSLKRYTQDVIESFSDDPRVLMWDVYNEPGNSGMLNQSLPLLKKVFEWAWEVRPSQPLTCGVWNHAGEFGDLNQFQLASSDVVTFHNYGDTASLNSEIIRLQKTGRPLICTEYMARTRSSRFETHLPVFREHRVGAINWGLVSGKTNTIFPWGSKEGSSEPEVWFHDIFRKDGTPFRAQEVAFIKGLTGKP